MRYAGGCGGVCGGFFRIIASEPRDDGNHAKTAGNDTIIGGETHTGGRRRRFRNEYRMIHMLCIIIQNV